MSSSYYVLCVSHDPAMTARDCGTAEDAAAAISAGIGGHLECDLLIEVVSGGPVEIGCPPGVRPEAQCRHVDVEWVDIDWLRLLARAHQCTDPGIQDALAHGRFYCWPAHRVRRLRYVLGLAEEPERRP